MTRKVFADNETSSLEPDTREIWNTGLIIRDDGQPDRMVDIIIEDADFTFANVESLRIGHAYERHPKLGGERLTGDGAPLYMSQAEAAVVIEEETRGAVVIGIVPSFDTRDFEILLKRHTLPFSGYYQPLDAEVLIAGYLLGQRAAGRDVFDPGQPPWNTDQLTRAVGVELPGEDTRHTGLGDACWARDLWDLAYGHDVDHGPASFSPPDVRIP